MPRSVKSQWDFGELFPTAATRQVLTVGELTAQVKRVLEKQIGQVWVSGEISNLRSQSSGHVYFTLKDAAAQLSCVLFRNERVESRHLLQDGQKVILQGDVTVYEPRGQYQLRVTAVEFQGVGALQLAFEKLKQKLNAEGLFAAERKRALPRYPQRLGLVTSASGAAIRDVLHVVQRRHPGLEMTLVPCRVQGQGAAEEIAAAIRLLNEFNMAQASCLQFVGANSSDAEAPAGRRPHPLDLILVTRGGGSLEDLWAFNEEVVARAIFESALPVVSAVGHEIDFTISDFVADMRAATPSAAAEIITEGVFASRQMVADAPRWMGQMVARRVAQAREDLARSAQRLNRVHPRRRLNEHLQRLDDLQGSLLRTARYRVHESGLRWQAAAQRFLRLHPALALAQRRDAVAGAEQRLLERVQWHKQRQQHRLAQATARLKLLSPMNVLERGYSITTDGETGKVLRDSNQVRPGQGIKTLLQKGEVKSRVEFSSSSPSARG